MGKLATLCLFGLGYLFLTGHSCSYTRYEIDLVPGGPELERTLTCSRQGDDSGEKGVDPAELARIASLYQQQRSPQDSRVHVFRDRFLEATPPDVGGAGRYLHLTSLLGSASAYAERFRGDDDQAAQLDRSYAALDRVLGHLRGWLAAELKGQPGLPRLLTFMGFALRGDLRTLLAHGGLAEKLFDIDQGAAAQMGVRVLQILVERGYLSTGEVHAWASAIAHLEVDPGASEVMTLLRRLVARKLGVDDAQPIPAALDFLADRHRARASLERYLAGTEAYRKRLAERTAATGQGEAIKPDPLGLFFDELAALFPLDLSIKDEVTVRLATSVRPFLTNGSWGLAAGKVVWIDRELKTGAGLPAFCYAAWAVPDETFQREHLGKVALADERLAEYVLWRAGLSAAEGVEWDDFLKGLKPGSGLTERLGAFRFSTDPTTEPARSLADTPRHLLLSGLEPASPDPERAEIRKAIEASITWALNKDKALLFSSVAQDDGFFIQNPDASSVVGFEAFRTLVERVFMNPKFKAISSEFRDVQIHLSRGGDVAWFSAVLDDRGEWDGKPAGWINARYTGVLEKREGRWVITQQHFSFPKAD
jgi:ketosteroid isomerase-like protein